MIHEYFTDSENVKNCLSYLTGFIVVLMTICVVRNVFKHYKNNKHLKKKKKDVDDRKMCIFQKLQGMQTPFENIKKFCSLSGIDLITKIRIGEIAPVDILDAYQASALINNNELNFIADVVYDADVFALLIKQNEKHSLMGWPLTINDTFSIEKYDCTQGLQRNIFIPCSKTSVIIRALKEEGAIPFIITNVCQGLKSMETSNPIFGRTVNPKNHKMTCGGSSGGEGASLGSQSSLIGIGNDVRGCIRIPASFCGVYGLKPTSLRVSSRHVNTIYVCDLVVNISIGPMARYIDDLIITFQAMTSDRVFEMDSYNPPVPFNETLLLSNDRLKIGFYTHIGGYHAHPVPAVERAVMMARRALEDAGHEVVEFNLPNIDDIFTIISKIFTIDAGKTLMNGLNNGNVDPLLRSNLRVLKTPKCIKYWISSFFHLFNKRLSAYISDSSGSSTYETWELKEKIKAYKDEVMTKLEKEKLDGIICPVLPIVALPLNTSNKVLDIDIYCTIYNILDYPAGSVPVTFVIDEDINKLHSSYRKMSNIENEIFKLQKESCGMPVGVQCVSKPWRDETCLRMMKDISVRLPK